MCSIAICNCILATCVHNNLTWICSGESASEGTNEEFMHITAEVPPFFAIQNGGLVHVTV